VSGECSGSFLDVDYNFCPSDILFIDLLLCLVTMPLTLVEILSQYWPLGRYEILCKLIGTLQATSIFVSTISITAIALDRYQVIVYPTRDNLQFMGAVFILTGIWIFSVLLASPMYIFHSLISYDVNMSNFGITAIRYCVEDWPIEHGRAYYSTLSLCVQYLLPILIVSLSYLRIYSKLRNRLVVTGGNVNNTRPPASRERERGRRMQRTNCLLISIAVIFGVSWLPLNLFNLLADVYFPKQSTSQTMMIWYAICHMMGMSSACSNPLLYGWLNDNFRKEFNEILCRKNESSINPSSNGKVNVRNCSLPEISRIDQKSRLNLTEMTVAPTECTTLVSF
jgi:neuropeptide F receptor